MTDSILLHSYKMTFDTGFAPNPYWEVLSLATCRPDIRRLANVKDWIAGFTSRTLCGDDPGKENLVYLMQVTEKIPFEEYYKKYPQKRPANCICGDNIYKKLPNGEYEQILNYYHGICEIEKDTSTPSVLLSENFYYFGKDVVDIHEYRSIILKGRASKLEFEQARNFINWVIKDVAAGRHGLIGEPHGCPKSKSYSKKKGMC